MSAGLTLAILVLPIVIITAAEAVRAVPNALREAATAWAPPAGRSSAPRCSRTRCPGSSPALCSSLARALGEAAPLILVGATTGRLAGQPCLLDLGQLQERFTALPIVITEWTKQPAGGLRRDRRRRHHRDAGHRARHEHRSPSCCATTTRRRGPEPCPPTDLTEPATVDETVNVDPEVLDRPEPEPAAEVVFDVSRPERVLRRLPGGARRQRRRSTSTRSPRSSARPAAARPRCCGASTA